MEIRTSERLFSPTLRQKRTVTAITWSKSENPGTVSSTKGNSTVD